MSDNGSRRPYNRHVRGWPSARAYVAWDRMSEKTVESAELLRSFVG
jgi:hypothetical protein